jgi:hypothetical protein
MISALLAAVLVACAARSGCADWTFGDFMNGVHPMGAVAAKGSLNDLLRHDFSLSLPDGAVLRRVATTRNGGEGITDWWFEVQVPHAAIPELKATLLRPSKTAITWDVDDRDRDLTPYRSPHWFHPESHVGVDTLRLMAKTGHSKLGGYDVFFMPREDLMFIHGQR